MSKTILHNGRWARSLIVIVISLILVLGVSSPNGLAPTGKPGAPNAPVDQESQPSVSLKQVLTGVTETTSQIMARQKDKDAYGVVEPSLGDEEDTDEDIELPDGPPGLDAASTGVIPNSLMRSPLSSPVQTLGNSFKADQYGNMVPPDTQGAVGPAQFLSATNYRMRSFDKTTGTIGSLDVTLNTFFASVSGVSTFDVIVRYDRLTQRFFVTAENGTTPNKIFIAVSNSSVITPATVWTFYSFLISTVNPVGDATCFADYPATGIDAHSLIIGVNNFCPTTYSSSAVYIVDKNSVISGGLLIVNVFRNIGTFTPRGVDSWDPDPDGTQASYFISSPTTTQMAIGRITYSGTTPSLAGLIYVSIPTIATPTTLEGQGNAHPGGTYNGKVDGDDTRFMPAVIRNRVLWAAQGSLVNSSGIGSVSGDRDAMRWYQVSNLDTTPALIQSGTIFDSTASSPQSFTYGSLMTSGQGHTVFGFSVISANGYNSGGFTGRLANDSAGFTSLPQINISGVGAYNAFDKGTTRAQRWGDYSQVALDPCDDMTMWTVEEFTAKASTVGSSNSEWGTQAAALLAPPPATPASTSLASVYIGQSNINVTITGTSTNGSGFYDTPSSMSAESCRKRITASVSGGVIVNSITYTDPTHVTLNISAASAAAGQQTVTITNPDGQSVAGAILPITLLPVASTTALAAGTNPSVFGQPVTLTATVSGAGGPPTGSVTFSDNSAPLATVALSGGVATLTTSTLAVGNHANITAAYTGDISFGESTSPALLITVNKASSSMIVTANPNPANHGQTVVLTAAISAVAPGSGTPGGSMTFYDNGQLLGTGILTAGTATFNTSGLAIGIHTNITAVYTGDGNFNPVTGNLPSLTINNYQIFVPVITK